MTRDEIRQRVDALNAMVQQGEIMAAMRNVLHDKTLALTGYRLVNLRHEFSDARRDPDGETIHGIMRLRAVTEPVV